MFKLRNSFSVHWPRVFFYGIGGLVLLAMVQTSSSDLYSSLNRGEPMLSLWVGTHRVGGEMRLASLRLVRYEPVKKEVGVISIPPQTRVVDLDGKGISLAELSREVMSQNGDLGSVLRQNVTALFKEERLNIPYTLLMEEDFLNSMATPLSPWRWVRSMAQTYSSLVSNLGPLEKILIFLELKHFTRSKMHWLELPGRSRGRFWVPDSLERLSHLLSEEGLKSVKRSVPLKSQLTLEVWNGSGRKDVALEVTRKLRRAGFDVVKWGNYSKYLPCTEVRDLKGNIQEAQDAARLISVSAEVYTKIDEKSLVDMVVIVGQDYELKGE